MVESSEITESGRHQQRFTFDAVAASYDKARPGYPASLFDDIRNLSGLTRRDAVLELGCGTGKATRALADISREVVALDPGGQLLAMAQSLLADCPNVRFVESTFETWEGEGQSYGLVASAQAFHWIAPEIAAPKSADMLAPGGWLAVFGNVPVGIAPGLLEGIRATYAKHVPAYAGQPPGETWYLPSGPVANMIDASQRFSAVVHRAHPWTWSHTTQSYVDFVRSRSDSQILPEAQREAVLADLAKVVDDHGGKIDMSYETHLYMAQRLPRERPSENP